MKLWYFLLLLACILVSGEVSAEEVPHQGLVGFTYTQYKIFISRSEGSQIANIQIYGWGNHWPFPGEGLSSGHNREVDNGEVMDQRIRQAVNDGQQVMLTCATAPSIYRQSGKPYDMEERVMDSMEDQYAARCAQVVKRWPQIKYVQVWNEWKGYFLKPEKRYDYESYTRFYNKVYHAVKSVRPDVLVGGGYMGLRATGYQWDKPYNGVMFDSRRMDAMEYWIAHADGFDAVCLDGPNAPEDFAKITQMFRQMAPGKAIWWAEIHSDTNDNMRKARALIEQDQRPGDIALWWASGRYQW